LTNAERDAVLAAVAHQNGFPSVFDGVTPCPTIDEIPDAVRDSAVELFKFGFGLLTDLGTRDAQYREIFIAMPAKLCPFCGCERFDAPGSPRHDLDHYLPISRYPFSGANLRNLVPAGDRCNKAYKVAADILRGDDGTRRRCYDPYAIPAAGVQVDLTESELFARENGLPQWHLDLGASDEAATWDAVWKIRERYQRDVLDVEFAPWLSHFATWCRKAAKPVDLVAQIESALADYLDQVIQNALIECGILWRSTFEMLRYKLAHGDDPERLAAFLRFLVTQP
jgi:hypothetical protein